jgi:hypothetical protein
VQLCGRQTDTIAELVLVCLIKGCKRPNKAIDMVLDRDPIDASRPESVPNCDRKEKGINSENATN